MVNRIQHMKFKDGLIIEHTKRFYIYAGADRRWVFQVYYRLVALDE